MSKLDTTKIFVKGAKPTQIGGQAVMEGIMMQGPDRTSLAMRLPNGEIYLKTKKKKAKSKIDSIPFIRGIFVFVRSFINGMSTLMESADLLEEYMPEEEIEKPSKLEQKINEKYGPKAAWNVMMFISVALAILITIFVFVLLPTYVANFLEKFIPSSIILNLIEGLIRIAMFVLYVFAISKMEEIHTLFQYHGAEHKTIHCFESGAELTPSNADAFYTLHPRCGTSFLVFVLIVSLLLFSLLGWPSLPVRIISRILLIPVIAGISYELLRLAGRSDNKIIKYLSYPGIMLQKITTAEPTREQLEIAIIALKAVLVDPDVADVDGFFTGEIPKDRESNAEASAEVQRGLDEEYGKAEVKRPSARYSDSAKSIYNTLKWGEEALKHVENGKNEAQILFSYVSGMTKTDMILRRDEILREDDFIEYRRLIEKRLTGQPLQYLTKVQEFMGLPFKVSPAVLIPRLDTEVLAEKVIEIIRGLDIKNPRILDMCTGSGVLGVSIGHEIKDSKITLSDVSVDAINVAISNAQLNDVFNRCAFALGDMFNALGDNARFDVIVSNPPYIESDIIKTLQTEVKDHEPLLALDGGEDGLDFYRIIARDAAKYLNENGVLALEIGCDQGDAVKVLLENTGNYVAVSVLKDLNGLDRVVIAGRK